jgi:hypothetical protein
MPRPTLRILAYLELALGLLASDAEAGVGDMSAGTLSSFPHLSPVQTVQSGDCWYDDGPNGPGYYPCGDGLGGGGPVVGPALRRHHRHGIIVAHPPAPNSGYPGAATITPGFAGGGFHSLGGGNFHQFHNAGVPHVGAPVSPGFAGAGGFHPGGAIGTPHIGAPASLGSAGVGTFHAGGGLGAPHIGAPASPGLAGGGFHGVGGGGVFQGGGGAFGQGGIGHR